MENQQVFKKGILLSLLKTFSLIPLEGGSKLKKSAEYLKSQGLHYCEVMDAEISQSGHISRMTYIEIGGLISMLDTFGCELLDKNINSRWPDAVYRAQHELEGILEANSFLFMWWNSPTTQFPIRYEFE